MSKKTKGKKRSSSDQRDRRKNLAVGLGLTLVMLLLASMGAFERLELNSEDLRYAIRGPREMKVNAAVVAIDDESMNGWTPDPDSKKPSIMPERWIWPRDVHATLVRNLKAAGAKLIAFDVLFSESSKRHPQEDVEFAKAVKEAGNVILPERLVDKAQGAIKVETLIPALAAAARDIGHPNANFTSDGALRALLPFYKNSNGDLDPERPNLDVVVLRQLVEGKAVKPVLDMNKMQATVGRTVIPFNDRGLMEINFAGPPQTVPTFPYHSVYFQDMDMSVFKDKVVYVGSTSNILHDNATGPFTRIDDQRPGVESHVHMLDTMLTGLYIRRLSPALEMLITLFLGLLVSLLTIRTTAKLGAFVMLMVGVAYGGSAILAFESARYMLPFAEPLITVVVTFAGLAAYRAYSEEVRARSTRAMFSRYVSRQIVEEILHDPEAVGLGGQLKEVTILFSDVRGFTAMSEKLSAPEVVTVLNEYLTAMVDIIIANNGTVDKYVGDAIMAVWGSPLHDPEHKQNGVRTAVQMMEVLKELQAKWAMEGKPHIDIGIGLNTGHVVAGNMGHPDYKMDYTVIGDDVNLAARMESANKEMRSHVLITGSTYAGCEDMVEVIKHPPIHVKGKEAAVDVIEVIGWKGQGRAPWAEPLPLH
jgi:adenylate cyclase